MVSARRVTRFFFRRLTGENCIPARKRLSRLTSVAFRCLLRGYVVSRRVRSSWCEGVAEGNTHRFFTRRRRRRTRACSRGSGYGRASFFGGALEGVGQFPRVWGVCNDAFRG